MMRVLSPGTVSGRGTLATQKKNPGPCARVSAGKGPSSCSKLLRVIVAGGPSTWQRWGFRRIGRGDVRAHRKAGLNTQAPIGALEGTPGWTCARIMHLARRRWGRTGRPPGTAPGDRDHGLDQALDNTPLISSTEGGRAERRARTVRLGPAGAQTWNRTGRHDARPTEAGHRALAAARDCPTTPSDNLGSPGFGGAVVRRGSGRPASTLRLIGDGQTTTSARAVRRPDHGRTHRRAVSSPSRKHHRGKRDSCTGHVRGAVRARHGRANGSCRAKLRRRWAVVEGNFGNHGCELH